jgi:uncharacterized protein YecE (DUF72 family)
MSRLRVGTCSWKFDSWQGLVYTGCDKDFYLAEYARRFETVEIDQWFWSLFPPDRVVLPRRDVAARYAAAVPPEFRFTVKLPNSLSLTHFYRQSSPGPPQPNPHFLSPELFARTLDCLEPLRDRIGVLMLQFEYLNRQKMPRPAALLDRLASFAGAVDRSVPLGIELRNPNLLNDATFDLFRERGMVPVFIQGYYMPDITGIYTRCRERVGGLAVIRLHGPERREMEQRAGGRWDQIVEPRDEELGRVAGMVRDLLARNVSVYLNVNNHYEGSAPLTIGRLAAHLPVRPE